jgi:drug/metabolite transporter (DMT)-like permease
VHFRPLVPSLLILLVVGGVIYPWCFLSSLKHTSATNSSLLIALNPVFSVLAAPFVGERLTRHKLAGVLLAMCGAASSAEVPLSKSSRRARPPRRESTATTASSCPRVPIP